jgi:DNA-directed RNA polymerase specialized sigma24 family protein
LIAELKVGDDDAVQKLWHRYFAALVRLARARLRATPRTIADEEDVVVDAFDSFCTRAARGQFPHLGGRDDLWRVLMTITIRKAADQVQGKRRQKRGGGRVHLEVDLDGAGPEGDVLAQIAGTGPTPEFAAMAAEQYQRLLESLGNETLRRVAVSKMEGYTDDEIAARIDRNRRTVARYLNLIRKIWLANEP